MDAQYLAVTGNEIEAFALIWGVGRIRIRLCQDGLLGCLGRQVLLIAGDI